VAASWAFMMAARKGEDWKGCLQQSEASKSRRATRVSGSRWVVGKEEEKR
jgi:hypothetical protein